MLISWDQETGAIHQRNPEWHGTFADGAADTLVIVPVNDLTKVEELQAGNIDVFPMDITPDSIDAITTMDGFDSVQYARAGMGYLTFNTAEGPTADIAVRQAMMFAFDRVTATATLFNSQEIPEGIAYVPTTYQNPVSIVGPMVRGEVAVDGLETYDFDTDRANQILDDAGWVRNAQGMREKDGETLTIKILSMPDHSLLPTLVSMWDSEWTEIGADVQVAYMDFNAILDIIYSQDQLDQWNVFFLATSFTGDDMSSIYTVFHSSQVGDGLNNFSRIQDEELDGLLMQALQAVNDEAAQKDLYDQVAVRLNYLVASMPIYGNVYFDHFNSDRVEGWRANSLYDFTRFIQDVVVK